jgi:hypothetical protein
MAEAKKVRGRNIRCAHCGGPLKPRTGRQKYCKREECSRKRKYEYWSRYIEGWKRRHPGYWESYLKRWRRDHPNYFREWRREHPNYFREWYRKNKERLRRMRSLRRRRAAK